MTRTLVIWADYLTSRLVIWSNVSLPVVPAKAGTQTEYELHKPLVLSDVLSLPHEGWTGPDSVCEGVICCQKGRIDDATVVDVIQELNFGRCQGKDALQQWKSSLPERRHICHCPVVHGTTT